MPSQLPSPLPSPTPAPMPSAAPVTVPDAGSIASVRVGFYLILCPQGTTPPRLNEGYLRLGCTGFLTATPKQADGRDVPSDEHGREITWELVHGDGIVRVLEDPAEPFNKALRARGFGAYQICAHVRGVRGCLGGAVI